MKLQTGNVAYYFPNIESLKDFIKLNDGKLVYAKVLILFYYRYKNICFVFNWLENGKMDWNAYFRIAVTNIPIIKYVRQRTE